jgi:hypothetical protein
MDAVMTLMQLNAGTINTNNNKDTLWFKKKKKEKKCMLRMGGVF